MLNSQAHIRLTYAQCDQVVVYQLQEYHDDLKEAMKLELEIDVQLDILRTIVAIETVLRDFLTDDEYLNWKTVYGVDLLA